MNIIILLLLFTTKVALSQSNFNFQEYNYPFNYFSNNQSKFIENLNNTNINNTNNLGLFNSIVLSESAGFGRSVSNAGDLNGDGFDDVIIGGGSIVYIYYGGSIMDSVVNLVIHKPLSGFGVIVSDAGDVNGDGFDDVLINAPFSGRGYAFIYFGGLNMDTTADITFGGAQSDYNFGLAISGAGDVNADGFDDIIISNEGNTRKTQIYFGGYIMDNVSDLTIPGNASSVSNAGDVNGDGFDDVIIGNNQYALVYNEPKGGALIYYGGVNMDNNPDIILVGNEIDTYFGSSVSIAGDVNNDGYSDVIVGAFKHNVYTGKATIFLGGAIMDTTADVTMSGEFQNSYFGYSVSNAGDINNDNFDDIIIGAYSQTGNAFIYFGGGVMNNIPDILFSGESQDSHLGFSVSGAGDINRDNHSDIIIGSLYGYVSKTYIKFNALNLLLPLDSSINIPLASTFSWNKVNTALSYSFTISEDSLLNNPIMFDSSFVDTFKMVSNLEKDTKYYWRVNVNDNSGIIYNSSIRNFRTIPPKKINLSILMEGLYNPFFNQLMRKDSVSVYLRDAYSPFTLRDSASCIIDTVNLSGSFIFPNITSGTYYINVKHFNSIETWSKVGGESIIADGSIYNYDFISSISQAFGNNLKLKGNKYCIYSGDCNQDGSINLSDVILVYNSSVNFVSGTYLQTDLNGDSNVDLTDVALCYNNSINFVSVITP
jgi:hypothetical protein